MIDWLINSFHVFQTIANWMFFKDNLKVAITRPRLHCQLFPPTVVYEPTLPPELIPKLESYDHQYVTNSTYDVSGESTTRFQPFFVEKYRKGTCFKRLLAYSFYLFARIAIMWPLSLRNEWKISDFSINEEV